MFQAPIKITYVAVAAVLLEAAPFTFAAEATLTRHAFSERHMGTLFQVILYAPDEPNARETARAAFRRIAQLDGIMSDYKETSELMRLCKKAGGAPVAVSNDLFVVLSRAQEVSRLSDGAFDVTVGPVVRLWRRARKTKKMPDKDQLARALALVGYQKIKLDPKARTVQLATPGMLLDLGGIAKGYTADAVLALLKERGITRALVAGGGDIAVSEAPPHATGWKIGIAPLENPDKPPRRYLLLRKAAVSTSGDYEQHVDIGGKRYSHIVDPKTGIGLIGRSSVTVVAPNGITADSLTKVVSVLGPRRGFAIVDKIDGVASYVVRKTEKGEEEFESRRFAGVPQEKRSR
jgi:thiamine biosynthesis lipoprotein